jgi:uncharacterized membrane protein YvbJ
MFCPNCGDGNPDEARFCGKCGRPMPAVAAAGPSKGNPTGRTAAGGGAAQLTAPAVSDGLKWGVAIGSVLVPIIGLVMGIIYVNDAEPEKKAAAKIWFIAGGIGFLFYLVQCSQSGNY